MHAHKELSARVRELEERIQVWRSGRGLVLLSRRLSTNARCSQALEQRRESETSATSKAAAPSTYSEPCCGAAPPS